MLICLISLVSFQFQKPQLIGNWILDSVDDRGDLTFRKDKTFTMRYFFDGKISDTVVIDGDFIETGNNILLLRTKGNKKYDEYFVDFLSEGNLVLRYKDAVSSYKKE